MSAGRNFQAARQSIKNMPVAHVSAIVAQLPTLPIPSDVFVPLLFVTFGPTWTIQADYHQLHFIVLVGPRDGQTLRPERYVIISGEGWLSRVNEFETLSRLPITPRWPDGSYGHAIEQQANDEMRHMLSQMDGEDGAQ